MVIKVIRACVAGREEIRHAGAGFESDGADLGRHRETTALNHEQK